MRIFAEETTGGELAPGELFSTAGPQYWDHAGEKGSLGERVYIRTEVPTPDTEAQAVVYRITVQAGSPTEDAYAVRDALVLAGRGDVVPALSRLLTGDAELEMLRAKVALGADIIQAKDARYAELERAARDVKVADAGVREAREFHSPGLVAEMQMQKVEAIARLSAMVPEDR